MAPARAGPQCSADGVHAAAEGQGHGEHQEAYVVVRSRERQVPTCCLQDVLHLQRRAHTHDAREWVAVAGCVTRDKLARVQAHVLAHLRVCVHCMQDHPKSLTIAHSWTKAGCCLTRYHTVSNTQCGLPVHTPGTRGQWELILWRYWVRRGPRRIIIIIIIINTQCGLPVHGDGPACIMVMHESG
jgi:hypothetical protein